jgi:hypothetical protein
MEVFEAVVPALMGRTSCDRKTAIKLYLPSETQNDFTKCCLFASVHSINCILLARENQTRRGAVDVKSLREN